MNFIALPDAAARQATDAATVFTECWRVEALAAPYAGSMSWKREGEYEYLVKTRPGRRLPDRLGARAA